MLTSDQSDALGELINIGIGRAAAVLNDMIEAHIDLQVPIVKVITGANLEAEIGAEGQAQLSMIQLAFQGSFAGTAALVFPTESAVNLVAVLTGEETDSPDLDALKAEALTEVGNVVMNGIMGSIGNMLGQRLEYNVPSYTEESIGMLLGTLDADADRAVLMAETRFSVQELSVDGNIMLFFEVGSFDALLRAINKLIEEG